MQAVQEYGADIPVALENPSLDEVNKQHVAPVEGRGVKDVGSVRSSLDEVNKQHVAPVEGRGVKDVGSVRSSFRAHDCGPGG